MLRIVKRRKNAKSVGGDEMRQNSIYQLISSYNKLLSKSLFIK